MSFRSLLQRGFRLFGYNLVKVPFETMPLPYDMDPKFEEIYKLTRPYTMASLARMYGLYEAINYVVKNNIPGDFVECGVWKGGCSMIAGLTLRNAGDSGRRLWLYDTYSGMTQPTVKDVQAGGASAALPVWRKSKQENGANDWNYASIDEVKENMMSTGYPEENTILVQGKVEETIPDRAPGEIAVLRLDTDWYESTYHELKYLFPKLSPHGVLILDDYGWWKGSREATDQYIAENNIQMLLNRIDSSCRMGIKS